MLFVSTYRPPAIANIAAIFGFVLSASCAGIPQTSAYNNNQTDTVAIYTELKKEFPEPFAWPLDVAEEDQYLSLSTRFGIVRNPITGVYEFHDGLDFSGPNPGKIRSIMDGTVVRKDMRDNRISTLVLAKGNLEAEYRFYSSQSTGSYGVSLKKGQEIGQTTAGIAGVSIIHITFRYRGIVIDPAPLFLEEWALNRQIK